jgi:tetraacyldisaccharide 4'-kinase
VIPLDGLQKEVFAVAGIANPERFFNTLRSLGYRVDPVVFPDHHDYRERDLQHLTGKPIVTTEKDAAKMPARTQDKVWVLRVEISIAEAAVPDPIEQIQSFLSRTT